MNTVEYWDSMWRAYHVNYRVDPLRDLVYDEIFKRTQPGRFLDLGGGVSRLAHLAQARGYAPYVVDHSSIAIAMLIQDGIDGQVVDLNSIWLPTVKENIEFVTATEVLEHLVSPELAIQYAGLHSETLYVSVPLPTAPDTKDHFRSYTEEQLYTFLNKYYINVETKVLNTSYLFAEATKWRP